MAQRLTLIQKLAFDNFIRPGKRPCFKFLPSQVQVTFNPIQYASGFQDLSFSAEERLGLSSMVTMSETVSLMAHLSAEAFTRKPHLEGLFLLDYNRLLRRWQGKNKRFEDLTASRATVPN